MKKISIIGLGYVGLPLAVAFGKKYRTVGYDINKLRVEQLKRGLDVTRESSKKKILSSSKLTLSSHEHDIKDSDFFIVTVPTPISLDKEPDLSYLESASKLVGKNIKKTSVVIYESTVFPGATEDFCAPIIENESGFKLNNDFFLGYSPERINPGDKKRKLENIIKIVSGSNKTTLRVVSKLYSEIIKAGVYEAESIKVAEAAKVIENTQRDVNIALMNELSLIFSKMNINTKEVLDAAGTKWNFLPFKPGLVGGHCIGVDPYYLTFKAKEVGYDPKLILAGRRVNDSMGTEIVNQSVNLFSSKFALNHRSLNALVMGFTFKEDCPDIRDTRVSDTALELDKKGFNVDVYDPWVNKSDFKSRYEYNLIESPENDKYSIVIIAVGHEIFKELGIKKIKKYTKKQSIIFDVKNLFEASEVDLSL
ncbi:nucleotide sugar dehydrogenase [Gammaproteobacteria bacterium]|nr:nucleotide sugar dehydrogenase [Gammaproteobacteria bacterium]